MRDYALGVTFDVKFTTRAFATGIPTDFDVTSPIAAVAAYPDNSLTQITAGITLTNNFDGIAGLHNVRVVATGGNGYAAGSNYALVITVGEVDGVSVAGEVIGEFSLEAQSPLRPTVAARTLDVSAAGNAGIDWGNIENPTTAQNLSATNIDGDQVVASVTGAVGSVTGNVGGNVTGTIGGLTAAALADFFDTDSGETYASAVAGSVVKEIADNATVIGTPDVNVVQISGDAAAADALESILDGGGGTITANITGNLSGSVGSVTGAVGSVTGNVGGNVVGNVNGNVVGSVGSVVGNVGGDLVGNVQGDVQGNVDGSVAVATALGAAAEAQVNAQVLDVLNVDTFGEPTGVPPATTTLVQKIGRLHMALRNEVTVDSNTGKKQFHDDGGAVEWEKDFTDAAGVYNESEGNAP